MRNPVLGTLFLCVVCGLALGVHTPCQGDALSDVLAAANPRLQNTALSGTFSWTCYAPAPAERNNPRAPEAHEVLRARVSEATVGTHGIREAAYLTRKAKGVVAEGTFDYTDNGQVVKSYDGRKIRKVGRGLVQASTTQNVNRLGAVLAPDAATFQGELLAHGDSAVLRRLSNARVAKETRCSEAGEDVIVLEGEYVDTDPERFFSIKVCPNRGWLIMDLEEADENHRPLMAMHSSNPAQVSGNGQDLWVAQCVSVSKWTWDDLDGDQVQTFRMDLLNPQLIPVDESSFSLAFPEETNIYDAIVNEFTSDHQSSLARGAVASAALQSVSEFGTTSAADLLARTAQAYACLPTDAQGMKRELELPRNDWGPLLLKGSVVSGVAGLLGLFVWRLFGCGNRHSAQPYGKEELSKD